MAMPVPSFWPVSRGEELVPQRKMDRNEEGTTQLASSNVKETLEQPVTNLETIDLEITVRQ